MRRLLLDEATVFQSTLSVRRATSSVSSFAAARSFQSTLSVRRATRLGDEDTRPRHDFNPRSP